MVMDPQLTLELQLPQKALGLLNAPFHAGVGVKTFAGMPLTALLRDQLGIAKEYMIERIQTIFFNNRAVDHIEEVAMTADAVIALSAAMPGLAGATLRKSGALAGFRQGISHRGNSAAKKDNTKEIIITLKLFNLVAEELAPQLLQKGVLVPGKILRDLTAQPLLADSLQKGSIVWNGRPISFAQLRTIPWPDGWVLLQARAFKAGPSSSCPSSASDSSLRDNGAGQCLP
jgi:hypothetical protein